ncbi:hypothetical protein, partial [Listeria monocytogenes]|uniref:hypothetical protein n=1 Tax=Listeria monocytogenes TaxID=1639 RepID=UPI001968ACBB
LLSHVKPRHGYAIILLFAMITSERFSLGAGATNVNLSQMKKDHSIQIFHVQRIRKKYHNTLIHKDIMTDYYTKLTLTTN